MAPKQTGIVCATLWRCEQIRYDLPVRSTFIIPCITQKLPRPISAQELHAGSGWKREMASRCRGLVATFEPAGRFDCHHHSIIG